MRTTITMLMILAGTAATAQKAGTHHARQHSVKQLEYIVPYSEPGTAPNMYTPSFRPIPETIQAEYIIESCRGVNQAVHYKPAGVSLNYNVPTTYTFTREELAAMPYTDLADIISLCAMVYQQQRGGSVYIGGGRTDGTLYVLDGMPVMR